LTSSDFFRGQTVAGGKWRKWHNAMDYPNTDVIIVVVLQVFREGIILQWTIQLHWQLHGSGGVLRRSTIQTPGSASCITMALCTETATIRLSVSQCVASGIILSLWHFDFEKKYRKALFFIKQSCIPLFYLITTTIKSQQMKLQFYRFTKALTTCFRNIRIYKEF
jgi:hypothetical protein